MDKLTWVAEQVSKHLDEVDNTCTPCAEVDGSSLTFEHVRYRCVQTQSIHLTNPGKVFVHFRLVDEEQLRMLGRGAGGGGGGGGVEEGLVGCGAVLWALDAGRVA